MKSFLILLSQILTKDSVTVFVNAIMYYKVERQLMLITENEYIAS